MFEALAVLSAATAAMSLPIDILAPVNTLTPTLCDGDFTTQITTPSGPLTLKAVANGTDSAIIAIGQSPTLSAGSTVSLNGTSPQASLSFLINGERYGWVVADVGHVSGLAVPVSASKNWEELKFVVNDDGSIFHQPTAATNMWMACNQTVNGEQHTILAWGNMNNGGTFPEGCAFTSVKQSCIDNLVPTYGP